MSTALKWDNRICGNVKTAVSELCTNVVFDYNDLKETFPTVLIYQIGGKDTAEDLDNTDTGAIVSYQVEVYTTGSSRRTSAKKIMDKIYDSFKAMGFTLDTYTQVGSNDTDGYRLVSRFKRFIGSGDTIDKQT